MKRVTLGLGVIVAGLALTASPALAQRPNDSGSPHTSGGGGGAVSRGSGGGGGTSAPSSVAIPASSGASSGSSSGSGSSPSAGAAMSPSMRGASASGPRQAAPAHRSGAVQGRFTGARHTASGTSIPRNDSTPIAGTGARRPPNPETGAVPSWARPRGGNAASDTAVTRTTPRPQPGGNTAPVYYYPGYNSCLTFRDCGGYYGEYGYGYDYYDPFYGSIYSPFMGYGMGLGLGGYPTFDPGFGAGDAYDSGVGSYSTSQYTSHEEGNLKLKVKPRSAKVYVDGYFVGVVDEFDGAFQKLPLTAGRHHVKIDAEGYQSEEFDAVITPEQTVTFQGTLKKVQ